jgi:hypothetical protein
VRRHLRPGVLGSGLCRCLGGIGVAWHQGLRGSYRAPTVPVAVGQ